MKAAVATGDGGIVIAETEKPRTGRGEALITVDAIGLNRGDLRLIASAPIGARLGWDFSGRIAVATRSGEREGVRVAGLLPRLGAWSEHVVATSDLFAAVPDGISDEVAAALPAAGLTALYVLEDLGPLIGRRLLVTGASGGVGHLACQLAAIGGAQVTGLVRGEEGAAQLRGLGVITATLETLDDEFDLIVDSVGGDTLAMVVRQLSPGGTCISIGATGGRDVTIDAFVFYQKQRQLKGFGLFPAIASGRAPRAGLNRLLTLIGAGRLTVDISYHGDWSTIAEAATALGDRLFKGKAVMRVSA